jgi:hypothetical protein
MVRLASAGSARAGRMVGVSKTEVGDSIALLWGEIAPLGSASPTAPSSAAWPTFGNDLRNGCHREAVCIDGLATRVQRPRGWANQKVPV